MQFTVINVKVMLCCSETLARVMIIIDICVQCMR